MNHQAIAFKLADMATRINAARLLCLKAAWEKDNGMDYGVSSSMAKVYAQKQLCGQQLKQCRSTAVMVL